MNIEQKVNNQSSSEQGNQDNTQTMTNFILTWNNVYRNNSNNYNNYIEKIEKDLVQGDVNDSEQQQTSE